MHIKCFAIEFLTSWARIATQLRWDSNSEALLYDEEGNALQAFTGGGGSDRREFYSFAETTQRTHCQYFYVEMACNGMFGNGKDGMIQPPDPQRVFTLAAVEIVELNLTVYIEAFSISVELYLNGRASGGGASLGHEIAARARNAAADDRCDVSRRNRSRHARDGLH